MPTPVLDALRELVEALDRRVPHIERAGEVRIGTDAAALRREAVSRIEALLGAGRDDQVYDQELADAILTDDGNPTQPGATRDRNAARGRAPESREPTGAGDRR